MLLRVCQLRCKVISLFKHHTLYQHSLCWGFPAGVWSWRGRSGSELLKCVLREALVWRGSDGLHLKIAPVNTPVTVRVCVYVCVWCVCVFHLCVFA